MNVFYLACYGTTIIYDWYLNLLIVSGQNLGNFLSRLDCADGMHWDILSFNSK